MVDLQAQYQRLKLELDEAIQRVVSSGQYIQGPEVASFVASLSAYQNGAHVIPCANGTDALQLAFMALDLKPGDEVITPVFTYAATAEVLALLGLVPVWVDVSPDTFTIDVQQIASAISSKTKAILPVHLYGQCADMEVILDIAHRYQLYVIEDAAQSLGALYRFANGREMKAGTMGIIGTTSFFPSKNLGCFGDGGAIFTSDAQLAERLRMLANHGQSRQYYHDAIGINSRLDPLQAAVLSVKLPYLDAFNQAREQVASAYDTAFAKHPHITIPYRSAQSSHIFHQYTLTVDGMSRNDLRLFLQEKGIPTMVYYPMPLNRQKAYAHFASSNNTFPIAESLAAKVISLPIHPEMSTSDIARVTETLLEYSHTITANL